MSAESTIEEVIGNALNKADMLVDEALAATDEMMTAALGYSTVGAVPTVSFDGVNIQPFSPDEDLGELFKLEYSNGLGALEGKFDDMFTGWMNTYFPKFNTCLPKAEDWLCETIDNGGQGLPVDVEEAIYARARDRSNSESFMLEQDAMDSFASMGFTMPTGHLSSVLSSIRAKSYDAISQTNREIAIEQAKVRLETLKFAVEQANSLRANIWKSLMDGVNGYMNMSGIALNRANAVISSKRGLWDSTAAYYDALVKVSTLDLEAQRINGDFKYKYVVQHGDLWKTHHTGRIDAARSAATILSTTASAYASAQNTIAHIGSITNVAAE